MRARSQVDQARLTDVGRDEFGCYLDRVEEQRKVTSRRRSKTELLRQDRAGHARIRKHAFV